MSCWIYAKELPTTVTSVAYVLLFYLCQIILVLDSLAITVNYFQLGSAVVFVAVIDNVVVVVATDHDQVVVKMGDFVVIVEATVVVGEVLN